MKRLNRHCIFAWVLLTANISLYAENIHGTVAGFIGDGRETLGFQIENIAAVTAQAVSGFHDGLELQIGIPKGLQAYPNSFALMLFKNITPMPGINNQSYTGTRVYMRLLPSRSSMALRIPFRKDHSISGESQILPMLVKPEEFPLLAVILPVVKGVPDFLYQEVLTIRAEPLLRQEGTVSIALTNLSGSPEERVTITIDGRDIKPEVPVMLKAGIHKITVSSTHAPIVEQTVAVEAGKSINIPITLEYWEPEMTVNFPEGSQVLFDGKEIALKGNSLTMEITSGEHEITGILGDYQITRKFTIRPGGRVSIDFLTDIKITEYGGTAGEPYGSGYELR
ncbi:MAG: hypothetical protein B0D92_00700 [Spirochaeta sp. LUC14_002_19_P3]|nr:MAG: hypothetical protein B0D92_00700 [Spirochaeta sp. LUC14_002_19_P3]